MNQNELFLSNLGRTYEEYLQCQNDDDYAIDDAQLSKLRGIATFLNDVADDCGGTVEPIVLSPREENGGVTATFTVFDVHGEQLDVLSNLLRDISALSIDVQDGKICVSATIPNIFKWRS